MDFFFFRMNAKARDMCVSDQLELFFSSYLALFLGTLHFCLYHLASNIINGCFPTLCLCCFAQCIYMLLSLRP